MLKTQQDIHHKYRRTVTHESAGGAGDTDHRHDTLDAPADSGGNNTNVLLGDGNGAAQRGVSARFVQPFEV